jgi:hypothetical protein
VWLMAYAIQPSGWHVLSLWCCVAPPPPRVATSLPLAVRRPSTCAYVGGGMQPGAALVVVCLAVVTLPPRSTAPTVAGCRLVGCSVVIGLTLCSRAVAGWS